MKCAESVTDLGEFCEGPRSARYCTPGCSGYDLHGRQDTCVCVWGDLRTKLMVGRRKQDARCKTQDEEEEDGQFLV